MFHVKVMTRKGWEYACKCCGVTFQIVSGWLFTVHQLALWLEKNREKLLPTSPGHVVESTSGLRKKGSRGQLLYPFKSQNKMNSLPLKYLKTVEFEVHLHADPTCCLLSGLRSCRTALGVSGCVWRASSCLLTRVRLCFTDVSQASTSMRGGGILDGPHLDGPGIGSGGSNSTPILFLLTQKKQHAHANTCTHTCTSSDWCRASLSACSTLLSLSLPPSLDLLFCLCSHSDPQLQPQPSPLTSRDCFSSCPLVFRGRPRAVSLASMPLSAAPLAWTGSDGDLGSRQTCPPSHGALSSGGDSYQVATPLPLSSRAFPVGRTQSRTGSVSDGRTTLSLSLFVFVFFFPCARAVEPARDRTH